MGTGTAALNAGSDTGLAGTSLITAMVINIVFSNTAITSLTDVPAIDTGGSPTITYANSVTPTIRFGALGCETPVAEACVIGGDTTLVVQSNLASDISITIDTTGVSGSSVRFGGMGTITLTSPLVTIIAETINLEGRDLVIVDAGGGRLTLAGNVSGAAAITARNDGGTTFGSIDIVGATEISGATISITALLLQTVDAMGDPASGNLSIIATGGLTIATGINISAGDLTLTAGTGDITGTSTPTLTAGTVSLTQAGTFADDLFTIASATSLTLEATTSSTDQIVHGWMVADDRTLSLTTTGEITVNTNIALVTGNLTLSGATIALGSALDSLAGNAISLTGAITRTGNVALNVAATGALTLNSNINTDTGALTLSGTSIVLNENGDAITLEGAAVMLTGAVDGDHAANDNDFTITATGDITINNNIDLGSGALILTATGANIVDVAVVVPVLTASTVSLTQDGTFAADLFTVASATSLTLDAGSAAQTVHAWMVVADRTLSLTTTGAITIGIDIATGTSNLTLDGGTLTLTAAATLSGADIALTGALTSADLALIITALGDITINDNISLGAGALTLTAGTDGSGDIADGTNTPILTASTVSLTQASAFGGTALFTFTTGTLELETAASADGAWLDDIRQSFFEPHFNRRHDHNQR